MECNDNILCIYESISKRARDFMFLRGIVHAAEVDAEDENDDLMTICCPISKQFAWAFVVISFLLL